MPSDLEVRRSVDHLFRRQAGQMVATLARIFGLRHLDAVEDSVQDALVQALKRWPFSGMPERPEAWLMRVARNRMVDRLRRGGVWEEKRQRLGQDAAQADGGSDAHAAWFVGELADDQLRMIFACCHPAIPRAGQLALTLKTVGGFSVAEIGRAFLTRETTIAQRLVRAKQRLRDRGVRLEVPAPAELPERLDAVLEAIYLMFNEGYGAAAGSELVRTDLCFEAIRLLELLAAHSGTGLPRTHALAALACFQASRLDQRVDAAGEILLLSEQDRSRWDRRLIAAGVEHLRRSAHGKEVSTYHLEAEIASCHTLAPSWSATDWHRILRAYDELLGRVSSPVAAVNRAVALAEVEGPEAALTALEPLAKMRGLEDYCPYWTTRGEMLRRAGRYDEANDAFRHAQGLETSAPVHGFLMRRLASLP